MLQFVFNASFKIPFYPLIFHVELFRSLWHFTISINNISHIDLLRRSISGFYVFPFLRQSISVFTTTDIETKLFKSMTYMGIIFGANTTYVSIE